MRTFHCRRKTGVRHPTGARVFWSASRADLNGGPQLKKSPLLVARAKYGIRTWLATAAASASDRGSIGSGLLRPALVGRVDGDAVRRPVLLHELTRYLANRLLI